MHLLILGYIKPHLPFCGPGVIRDGGKNGNHNINTLNSYEHFMLYYIVSDH